MKNTQRVTRVQLKIDQNAGSLILGIVSAEPDYKISLSLNKKFRISLKNISPVKISAENESEVTFSRFSDNKGSHDLFYCLISNRSGNHFLLKKLKNVDYIFHIQNLENNFNTDLIMNQLRDIESVSAVFKVDEITFKDKNLKYLTP